MESTIFQLVHVKYIDINLTVKAMLGIRLWKSLTGFLMSTTETHSSFSPDKETEDKEPRSSILCST